jgi:iron complex transport system permease protein
VKKTIIIAFFIAAVIVSLLIGAGELKISEIFTAGSSSQFNLLYSRIPRTLSLMIAGFGLSIAGLVFQQISNNKFISPTTSSAISGAQLGLAIALVFMGNAPTIVKMLFGFASSLLATFLFMAIMNRLKYRTIIYVPLLGMMLGSIMNSISTFLAYTFDFMQTLNGWFIGNLSLVISGRYELLYIVIPAIILTFIYAKQFTIVGLGEDFSINVGLNYNFFVIIGLVLIAIISASTVIIVGNLPFLGLIIPNIISMAFGDNLEKNVFTVGISGALFLIICDILGRVIIYPFEISIGLVIGVLGTLIFLFMVFGGRK